MRISSQNSNIAAYDLAKTSSAINRSLLRLSSGSRIVSPRDNAADYSFSVNLSSHIRGIAQANRNIASAQGALVTADGVLSQQAEILQKMRELAVRGSNSLLSSAESANLDQELQALLEEFRNLTYSSSFNGISLLDQSAGSIAVQMGAFTNDQLELSLPNTQPDETFTKKIGFGGFDTTQIDSKVLWGEIGMADFNNDGIDDVVAGTPGAGYIYLGDPDGGFTANGSLTLLSLSKGFAFGDFDEDGNVDIVNASNNFGGDEITLSMGKGDGSFESTISILTGTATEFARVGDVNNDGHDDIVVTHFAEDYVATLLGNGDGTFQTMKTHYMGSNTRGLQLADFNNDGNLDMIVTNPTAGTVAFAYGNGDGTFDPRTARAAGGSTQDVVVGDLDGDGDLDAIANSVTANSLRVFINDGTTLNLSSTVYSVSSTPQRIQLGDINRDGSLDVVSSNSSGMFDVLYNDGSGAFSGRETFSIGIVGPQFILRDLNNDNVLDILNGTEEGLYKRIAQGIDVAAIGDIRISTPDKAKLTLEILDTAIQKITNERSSVSSSLHRLEIISSQNLLQADTLEEARQNARDADIALEVAELTRNQILQQMQMAVLSQANLQMSVVLNLLRD